MSLATLARRMADSGASADLIAIVMEEVEALQLSLDARRAADRDRKRAQREAQKSADVTGHSEDSSETVLDIPQSPPALNKEKAPGPPKEIKSTPRVCSAREADRWHRMPEGWKPTKPLPVPLQAKVDQWPPGAFDDEVANLKRWAANAENKNGKGKKLDWDKALWTWIGRRHDERYSRQSGTTQRPLPRARPNLTDIIRATSGCSDIEGGDGTRTALPARSYG